MRSWASLVAVLMLAGSAASGGTYVFAGTQNGANVVTHVKGYAGSPTDHLVITVGIDPGSANRTEMARPTRNAINTLNARVATTGNVLRGGASDLGVTQLDFESVVLHELGHAIGLAHTNTASESGLFGVNRDYTKSTVGNNGVYDLDPGPDTIVGSRDDLRGDDENMYWFETSSNDPIAALPADVDSTTYSLSLADLPPGDTYAANSHRAVNAAAGVEDTEGVMQQGTFADEAQRTLTAEAVASLRYAMTGLDEIEGTDDDYTFELLYVGFTTGADVVIGFDDLETLLAETILEGDFIGVFANHFVLKNVPGVGHTPIVFNDQLNWYFNQMSNDPDRDAVYVDFAREFNGVGIEGSEFNTLAEALDEVNADGTIFIDPGESAESFAESGAIAQSVRIENNNPGGGVVRIAPPIARQY